MPRRQPWFIIRPCRRRLCLAFLVIISITILSMLGFTSYLMEIPYNQFVWPDINAKQYAIDSRNDNHHNSRVLNPNNYTWLLAPEIRMAHSTTFIYIIIKSFVGNFEQREAVRNTWGSRRVVNGVEVVPVFVMGRYEAGLEHNENWNLVELEQERNKDIFALDFSDTYRNNTKKFMAAIRFAHESPDTPAPLFTLLIDDDYILSVKNLVEYAMTKNSSLENYEGWAFDTSPFRLAFHKHWVSINDYPFSRYPPYISAGAVLLSQATVETFYHMIPYVKEYSFDDIYAGILAKKADILATHNPAFVFWTRETTIQEWRSGDLIAAHGYDAKKLIKTYNYHRGLGVPM
ncbi:unnamed protein product [Caenorhabditis auriculariae]|uniref:Hexosyltransferase n=1 Tax=Caenorhabditis auriculariae TaxID=2777116 RepID=A0A8S1H3C5_9PELO|nr:unnamed protein product [Caenorhabditis auriculariae]